MIQFNELDRTASIMRMVPGLFIKNYYKSILNIGAGPNRFDYSDEFKQAGYDVTVMEYYQDNCDNLKISMPWLKNIICGDVKNINLSEKYDVVFWWHGPEHLLSDDISPTVMNLERLCNKVIILGCPWGEYKTECGGPTDYNPAGHNSHNDYQIFENIGYSVECLGSKDVHGSNITAVKYIN